MTRKSALPVPRPVGGVAFWFRRLAIVSFAVLVLGHALEQAAKAQQLDPQDEERLQILADPDMVKQKLEGEKTRAPFEFFRSQIAPFDILPFIKPRHWSSVSFEMRANYDDYEGSLQFLPVMLEGMPLEMIFRRITRLQKGQRARVGMQCLLPAIPKEKELAVELHQESAIRHDDAWMVPVRPLPPGQMLILVLSKEASTLYASWSRLPCMIPSTIDREDAAALEFQRYYRLVLPEDVEKPFLSPHPLTWGTISHVVWDGLPPDLLRAPDQQALLDWLHWGGQLILVGGSAPNFSFFRDSFLNEYLPADPTGETRRLDAEELKRLSAAYRPNWLASQPVTDKRSDDQRKRTEPPPGLWYRSLAPIQPQAGQEVFLSGLNPRPESTTISLDPTGKTVLAVEARVGRGRITMLALNPHDPSLVAWPGLDTLIRRVILRRPEESMVAERELPAADLSWYRVASRDTQVDPQSIPSLSEEAQSRILRETKSPSRGDDDDSIETDPDLMNLDPEAVAMKRPGIAEWRDTQGVPRLCRDVLEAASGITVPGTSFVVKVIAAYLLAIVPLNLLVFRLFLNRREWAWVVVPLLALGFAIGVERAAAYDMGYDFACDEIDLLEIQGGYPRGHLSRFASIYTSGHARYQISYPNEPTALALPFNDERSIGGEAIDTAVWQSSPIPSLRDFTVQPRSFAMFRAEQMTGLSGPILIVEDESGRSIVNQSDLELRDAVVVLDPNSSRRREIKLGAIAPGATVRLDEASEGSAAAASEKIDGPDPGLLLEALRKSQDPSEESSGEIRLVAWAAGPWAGQSFEPELDRHRGVTVVIAHLRHGAAPSPDGKRYNSLAKDSAVAFADRAKSKSSWPSDEARP